MCSSILGFMLWSFVSVSKSSTTMTVFSGSYSNS